MDYEQERLCGLSPHLRGVSVAAINASILRGAVEILPGIAPGTRNRYLAAARTILDYAHSKEWRDNHITVERFHEGPKRQYARAMWLTWAALIAREEVL